MRNTHIQARPRRSRVLKAAAVPTTAAAALLLAACGSSGSTNASAGSGGGGASSTTAAPTSTSGGASSDMITVSSANVPGFGTVLVNGSGRTLYILSSEKDGKITCTDDNGCTKVWPDTELPSGQTAAHAGTGINTALLGTVKDAKGSLYVTYGGFPLYTFSGDNAAGQANGEGITSFGGTWYVLGANGSPVTARSSGAGSSGTPGSTPTTAASSGGYNY